MLCGLCAGGPNPLRCFPLSYVWIFRAGPGWASEPAAGVRAATLKAVLDRHELPSTCLDLEVTEGSLIADTQGAARILRELRGLGMGLDLATSGRGTRR